MELTPSASPRAATKDDTVAAAVGHPASDDGTASGGASRARSSRRRWLALLVIVGALVALGLVVARGLSEATVYFLNADEAAEQRQDLGDRRFRLQGTVAGEVTETSDGVRFDVTYNSVGVAVRHTGEPPQMFRPGIPVVLEGRWTAAGESFESDRMLVRHDAEYRATEDYNERIAEAEAEANAETRADTGQGQVDVP
jgi:cytochrome c-type biogenesis protein CcmE